MNDCITTVLGATKTYVFDSCNNGYFTVGGGFLDAIFFTVLFAGLMIIAIIALTKD